ncbi:MAG: DNA mismatch repair endonuclease MutL [Candidatus Omnitrophota bacterium]
MAKIKILPKLLADKIAAGEVVERPASVVKELMENALDAGSTAIEVVIEDAGCKLIRVIDNGEGMAEDDLKLAAQRHATSKISKDDDLNNINTLGFRGEALSSIAAVSFLTITSAIRTEGTAWMIEAEGGNIKNLRQTARTPGTTVEMRNLFYNTPARLKFLKSRSTEMYHITRTVTELALANPGTAFRLVNNNEEIINIDNSSGLSDRINILLGEEFSGRIIPINFHTAPLKVKGFISRAGTGCSTRKNQHIFVNKRPVIDKTISHAIISGYHTFLGEKQFPLIVLFLETPPASIDVNVHPSKREIRFRETSLLHDILVKLIKDALTQKENLPELKPVLGAMRIRSAEQPYAQQIFEKEFFSSPVKDMGIDLSAQTVDYLHVKNTYIVSQDKDGLIIIDQHAAHERILFDELLAQFKAKRIEKQKLLLPVILHLNKAQAFLVEDCKGVFRGLGFDIEDFGGQSFTVQAYPAVLGDVNIAAVFEKTLAEIAELDLSADTEQRMTQILAPVACHAAVRAHDKLSPELINALFDQLSKTASPYTCPHGRPTMITIKWAELEKRFKRT